MTKEQELQYLTNSIKVEDRPVVRWFAHIQSSLLKEWHQLHYLEAGWKNAFGKDAVCQSSDDSSKSTAALLERDKVTWQ